MPKKITHLIPKLVLALLASTAFLAQAAVITVTPTTAGWGTAPGDTNSVISNAFPQNGAGSLELKGDRTRFFGLGNPFSIDSSLGLLSDLVDFRFDWAIDANSISNLGSDYTPALRLHIFDGSQRSELIWEGAYNGTYGNTSRDTWYSTSFNDKYWQFISGAGATEIYNRAITDWQNIYSSSAYVSAISIGVGGGAGANYKAFADNVTIQFSNAEARTFNFEVAAAQVPAPAPWLLLLAGLGILYRFRK